MNIFYEFLRDLEKIAEYELSKVRELYRHEDQERGEAIISTWEEILRLMRMDYPEEIYAEYGDLLEEESIGEEAVL